jgi:hypothetical protein
MTDKQLDILRDHYEEQAPIAQNSVGEHQLDTRSPDISLET